MRTAALFVGVPAVLAIALALAPRSEGGGATLMLLKGSTLAMLIACVALPEGMVCLIFALPLTACISVVVGVTIDAARRRGHRRRPTVMAVSLPLLLFSLEGVVGSPVDAGDHATRSRVVAASPEDVAVALAAPPRFEADLPAFLAVGFDQPTGASGSGIDVGDGRTMGRIDGRVVGLPAPALVARVGAPLLGSSSSLALTGRRCVPRRLEQEGFAFRQTDFAATVARALEDLA
ncbi:MAG: DUF1731 domain-containing protein [Iamia sp.]